MRAWHNNLSPYLMGYLRTLRFCCLVYTIMNIICYELRQLQLPKFNAMNELFIGKVLKSWRRLGCNFRKVCSSNKVKVRETNTLEATLENSWLSDHIDTITECKYQKDYGIFFAIVLSGWFAYEDEFGP
jgi:hypothetical protein